MKKITITYNIFFIDTSFKSVAEEEGPVYKEDTPATHLEKIHKIQQIFFFGTANFPKKRKNLIHD